MRELVLLIVALVMGCGGGGPKGAASSVKSTGGKVAFTVKWPARSKTASRVIPIAADVILFKYTSVPATADGATTTIGDDSDKIARPFGDVAGSSTYTRDLPVGSYTVNARSFSSQDATVVVATGNAPLTIKGGTTAQATLTMGSTVTQLLVSAAASSVAVGGTTTLTATPKDKGENMVLVGDSTVTWKSSNPTVATVDATGLTPTVHALKQGNATFTATFNEVESTLGHSPMVSTPCSFTVVATSYLYHVESSGTPDGKGKDIIVRSAPNGANPVSIYSPGEQISVHSLRVSPDGSMIAFFQDPDQGPESQAKIVVIDSNGSLLSSFAAPNGADPLALGPRYLYHVEEVGTNDYRGGIISIVRSESNGANLVKSYSKTFDSPEASIGFYSLSASPDGSRVAFLQRLRDADEDDAKVIVLDSNGALLSSFTPPNGGDPLALGPRYLYHVESVEITDTRSRDIIVRSDPSGANPVTIYSTGESTNLYSLSASPDGSHIAFLQRRPELDDEQRQIVVLDQNGALVSSFAPYSGGDPLAFGP